MDKDIYITVSTVFDGKEADDVLSKQLDDKISKLAAKVSTSINESPTGKSIFERIRQVKDVFDWESIKAIFASEKGRFAKSTPVSIKLREKGNELYKQKNAEASLRAYNLAISFASTGSMELSTAYANRSAVLLQMGKISEALDDINRSLSDKNCSEGLRRAVQERKGKCEALLKTQEKTSDSENAQELKNILRKLYEIKDPHPNIPTAESFVKLEYSLEKGRHLTITKEVKAGTTLLVDKPFVSVLTNLLNWETSHCHNCSRAMLAGIPCKLCTFAMFCSHECLKSACDNESGLHRFEHNYLSILRSLNSSHATTHALRIMAKLGPTKLRQMCQQLKKINEEASDSSVLGYNEKGIYDTSSYHPIFCLISHEQRPNDDEDKNTVIFKTALKALVLKGVLKEYSTFFTGGKSNNDFEDFVAALILRHLENIRYNAISLSKLTQDKGKKAVAYATALFPLISLCNHSCDPNCAPVKRSEGLCTSLIALKTLNEGDELVITYKPLYTFMKTAERQKFLGENYLFVCNCRACDEKWGPDNVLFQDNGATLVLEPSRCDVCSAPENIKKKQCNDCALKDVDRAKEIQDMSGILFDCHDFMEQENWKECLQRLPGVIDYFGRNRFVSLFPLYHVALDMYKLALVHGVANL